MAYQACNSTVLFQLNAHHDKRGVMRTVCAFCFTFGSTGQYSMWLPCVNANDLEIMNCTRSQMLCCFGICLLRLCSQADVVKQEGIHGAA